MKYSTQYIATIVLAVTAVAAIFDVEIVQDDLTMAVGLVLSIVSSVWILVERFRKGGISAFGFRK